MIPVVDCENNILNHANEIFEATETVGFVYLKNFGISPQDLEEITRIGDKFWALPMEAKMKNIRKTNGVEKAKNTGYVPAGMENLDPTNAVEIREAFNIAPGDGDGMCLPDDVLPEFRPITLRFFHKCRLASLEIMKALAIGLGLDDPEFFHKNHKGMGTASNRTTLRLLYYPPLPPSIPPKSARCGEHSDYGTITLLFQDNVGGLEVLDRKRQFVPATPEPDAVLVNTGDLLQRWTADRLIAVKHRVLVPEDKKLYASERRSVAFFVMPDNECIVTPLDGSDKYPPISSEQHLINMYSKTY